MPTDPLPSPVGILRCDKCVKVVECLDADLRLYMRTRWPRCCGDVMTYFTVVGKPDGPVAGGAGE
jgi:hypothetical protein